MFGSMTPSATPRSRTRQLLHGAAITAVATMLSAAPALAQMHGHGGGGHGGGFSHSASVGVSHGGWGHGGWGHGYVAHGWGHPGWGYRHYGPGFVGFGYYYDPYLAWPFLGLAAWELADYSYLDETEMRAQENAMAEATSAPLSTPITWNDGSSSGSVTPVREGHTADGRTCREFQQSVSIAGRQQQAFGTACRQPDGSWQIVSQDDQAP